ncbi:hypothetical protein PHISP_01976 [Aspergillus sp. HF37]|nr:hypothetical protein PHISP_01976 [Aspergillus sp. HF37]
MTTNKAPLYQARSAGAAAKPMKNTNVVEMVQFLQSHNAPQRAQLSPAPTSPKPSSPVSPSAEPQNAGARDFLKAGHRRLRQFAQRHRKDSGPKSKSDDPAVHLIAQQREGLLPAPEPKVSALKKDIDSTLSQSKSLDSMRTSFKSEVENIGQPWLGDTPAKRAQEGKSNRLTPLALNEFTSMVDVSESSHLNADYDVPPPYQQSTQPRPSDDSHSSAPQLAVIEEAPDSTDKQRQRRDESGSTSGPNGDRSSHNVNSGTAVTTPHNEASDAKASSNDRAGGDDSYRTTYMQSAPVSQQGDSNPETSRHEPKNEAAVENTESTVRSPSKRSFSQPLKLFPDVMPPRTSSRRAVEASGNVAKHSTATPSTAAGPKKRPPSTAETKRSNLMASSKAPPNHDPIPRPCSSAQTSSTQTSEQDARSIGSASNESSKTDGKDSGRRTSLPLEALLASPLPAPTGPLPAVPKSEPSDCGRQCGNESPNSNMTPANGAPRLPAKTQASSSPCGVQRTSPMPGASSETATSKEVGVGRRDGSSQANASDQLFSALLDRRRHDREKRLHALRLKDTSQSRHNLKTGKPQGGRSPQCAALPMARQAESHKRTHESPASQRRNHELNPAVDRCTPRTVASEFPTPPPRSPLPSDPPIRTPGDSFSRRYLSSQTSLATVPMNRNGATSPYLCGSPNIRRSASARSVSSRHGPVESKRKHSDHSEWPLPSSDEEGPVTTRTLPPRNIRRGEQAMRDGVDADTSSRASHTKKEARRDSTQSQIHQNAWMSPPQSPHSDYTYRSQDSQSSAAASMVHSLEVRIAHLEQQNRVLQAALMATLDASGKCPTNSLLNGLAASFSGPRTSPVMGRPASSLASYSSSMDESASSLRRGKCDRMKSPRDNCSLSSFETSVSKHDSVQSRELSV